MRIVIESQAEISLTTLSRFINLPAGTAAPRPAEAAGPDYAEALALFERRYLADLLRESKGNVEEAARLAGMNMATIYRKLKKHQLQREDFCD